MDDYCTLVQGADELRQLFAQVIGHAFIADYILHLTGCQSYLVQHGDYRVQRVAHFMRHHGVGNLRKLFVFLEESLLSDVSGDITNEDDVLLF